MPLLRSRLLTAGLAAPLAGALAALAGAALAQGQMPQALTPPPLAGTEAPPAAPLAAVPLPPAGEPPAAAEPPPAPPAALAPPLEPVQAAPLQAPDLFSSDAGQPTGLPPDLWNGASLDLAHTVMPLVASRPLSPAAAAFARRLMSTPSAAPRGGGSDAELAAARVNVVLSLGDPVGARTMLEHTPGVRQSADLSQVAAETDLVLGREDEACTLVDNLVAGKDSSYFRRLRAFCLLKAGDKPGAQLAFDLASEQAKDDVYKRLMSAALNGTPPGAPSLRNGMEYALSKRLQLDLSAAAEAAWAPVLTVIAQDASGQAKAQAAAAARVARRTADTSRASTLNPAVRDAALAVADGRLTPALSERLAAGGASGQAEAQQALALYAAAGAPGDSRVRAVFAGFDVGPSRLSQARLLELDAVSVGGARGDAALLTLWLASEAGEAGPTPADRARIVRALTRAGFAEDARAYALEGLLSLQPPPPPPPPKAAKPAKPAKAPARRKR